LSHLQTQQADTHEILQRYLLSQGPRFLTLESLDDINALSLSIGYFLLSLYWVFVRIPSKSLFALSIILQTSSIFSPMFSAAEDRIDHLASLGTKKACLLSLS
jgi:hypothetical protein